MRDPARIDRLLSRIRRIWLTMPDLRFCQLLANASRDGHFEQSFYYEDDRLERDLESLEQLLYLKETH